MTRPIVAVTQRVVDLADRRERRDAVDQQWAVLLESLGLLPVPMPNALRDPTAWLTELDPSMVILTGGNDLASLPEATDPAPERDATESAALHWATERHVALLGVCRGLQVLALHWGLQLTRVVGHVATLHELQHCAAASEQPLRRGSVNSFHSWALPAQSISDDIVVLATAPDGTIEAIRHRSLPQVGLMWHPERDPADDHDRDLITQLLREAAR